MQFPEDSTRSKKALLTTRFFSELPALATPVRKLSTGMIRKSPACRRASSAFSPAGTRKTSAPVRRAPITFCLTPPIGITSPSSSIAPVTATSSPRSTSPRSFLDDVEREREARGRAADAAEVDLDVDRQLDVGRLLDLDADDRPARLLGARDRADLDLLGAVASPDAKPDALARLVQRRSGGGGRRASSRPCRRRRRSRRSARSCPAAGASEATPTTSAPSDSASTS